MDVEDIIGESDAIKNVLQDIESIAQSNSSVIITGESGTGKELVARAIHSNSPRKYFPMISVHCGALTESLLESELFGHEKGAFTGATFNRKGRFEMADGGTIFLDEIATISPKMQIELLRVLESKTFVRVGGNKEIIFRFQGDLRHEQGSEKHGEKRNLPGRSFLPAQCAEYQYSAAAGKD